MSEVLSARIPLYVALDKKNPALVDNMKRNCIENKREQDKFKTTCNIYQRDASPAVLVSPTLYNGCPNRALAPSATELAYKNKDYLLHII